MTIIINQTEIREALEVDFFKAEKIYFDLKHLA